MIEVSKIDEAAQRLEGVALKTPLQFNEIMSEMYGAQIYLKREDLQLVRSYKLRGAYNLISTLSDEDKSKGVVCASAGNHAQGVAYSCKALQVKGTIFMPETTPKQKVRKVELFGEDWVDIVLVGDTFDDCYEAAVEFKDSKSLAFVHPFNASKVMEGQGTVGKEIWDEIKDADAVLVPVGGGGLAAGVSSYLKTKNPNIEIIGVEPEGAPSMQASLAKGEVVKLDHIEKFVDGAAVKEVGMKTFEVCQQTLDGMITVPEGKICTTILRLYNEEAIVVEPAGALTISSLGLLKDRLKGKKVVCVVSGSNNDIERTQEIKERSLMYEGLKHYFIIKFPQRSGALKEFVNDVLGPNDDITRFEYVKKSARQAGPALVGVELTYPEDLTGLMSRMKEWNPDCQRINDDPQLFEYFV